ncbi:MAG: hypothetical protein IPM51_08515 [Sphingobacteriaceae bacterium]|nr:hypothetical protein [Sphingobacteriaceae bacterium]
MRFIFFLSLLLINSILFSQAPQKINYQGLVRDANGIPVTTLSTIGIQFKISDNSNSVVHDEIQTSVPVNSLGLFSTKIGATSAISNTITWENGPYTLTVNINTGSGFNFLGAQELVSVPFALYAKSAGSQNSSTISINNPHTSSGAGTSSVSLTIANPTLNTEGIATSSSNVGYNLHVSVPDPSLNFNNVTNQLSINQGTAISTVTLNPSGASSISITGSGNAFVTPTLGTNFVVNVPNQILSISNGSTLVSNLGGTVNLPLTQIQSGNTNITVNGSAPSYTISSSPSLSIIGNSISVSNGNTIQLPPPTSINITGGGITNVLGTSPNFTVNTSTPTITGAGSTTVSGSYPNYTISTPTVQPGWSIFGNAATNPTLHFLGTTDNVPLSFRVNNQSAGFLESGNGLAYFGYQAGTGNSGVNSTALGSGALSNSSTGNQNTAVGYRALQSNSTGFRNTAVGSTALNANTTGSVNSAFGYNALNANTTGSANSGFGASALRDNFSGEANSAFGQGALISSATGGSNSAFGTQALNSVVNGSFNTAVGAYAGYSATGSNNVFIGYQAGYNETGSNKLYIANQSTNPPLIYGDFSNGRLGLGTILPAEKLHLVGLNNGNERIKIESPGTSGLSEFILQTDGNSLNALQFSKWGSTAGGSTAGVNLANLSHIYSAASGGPMLVQVMTNNTMHFATFNTVRMRIFGDGNIAFGNHTTNPVSSHYAFIKPGANNTKVLIAGGDNSNTYGGMITLGENSIASVGMSIKLNAPFNRIQITNDVNGLNPVMSIGGYLGATNGVAIGTNYANGTNPPADGLIVEGNVGIGGTNPNTNSRLMVSNGHIQTKQTTAPTIAFSGGHAGAITLTPGSTDVAGRINLNFTNVPCAGCAMMSLTFNTTYANTPVVVITPVSLYGAIEFSTKAYYVNPTTTGFTIHSNGFSVLGQNITFTYFVIEAN